MATPASSGPRQHVTSKRKVSTTQVRRTRETVKTISFEFPWNRQNVIFLGIGIATLIVGYLLMETSVGKDAQWDNPLAITLAPIVLVIGYLVIIPLAIMKYPKQSEQSETDVK